MAIVSASLLTHRCWTIDPVWTSRVVTLVVGVLCLVGTGLRIRSTRQFSLLELTLIIPLLAALVVFPVRLIVVNSQLRSRLDKSQVRYELIPDGKIGRGVTRYATLLSGSNYEPVSTVFATKLYSMWINAGDIDESLFALPLADTKSLSVNFPGAMSIDERLLDWLSTCSDDCDLRLHFSNMKEGRFYGLPGKAGAKVVVSESAIGQQELSTLMQNEHQCLVFHDVALQDIDFTSLPSKQIEALVVNGAGEQSFRARDLLGLAKLLEPKYLTLDVVLTMENIRELASLSRLETLEYWQSSFSREEVEALCECPTLKNLTISGSGLSVKDQESLKKHYPRLEINFYNSSGG